MKPAPSASEGRSCDIFKSRRAEADPWNASARQSAASRSSSRSSAASSSSGLTRALYAAVWFAETVALFAFACLLGYLVYRILLGTSDDPRRSA